MNACGGSKVHLFQERLDECMFHGTYLRDTPTKVHILGGFLAKYCAESIKFVNKDVEKDAWDVDCMFYRCKEIKGDEEQNKSKLRNQPTLVEGHWNFTSDDNYSCGDNVL